MLTEIIHTGRRAALAAGAVLRRNYLKPQRVMLKSAIDPVTETDLQSQDTIITLIRQTFPDHTFLAEEERVGGGGGEYPGEGARGTAPLPPPPDPHPPPRRGEPCVRPGANTRFAPTRGLGGELEGRAGDTYEKLSPGPPLKSTLSPPYRWIIDPLDGTVNFAHGFPMFCVSIAFEAEGVLEYGVVYDPLRDELFEAVRGRGATLNGAPIRASTTDHLDRALLATGFPYDIRERLPQTMARLGRMLGVAQGVRRAGSAALDLAYVACGRLDGFWEENLKPWDTAAGCLLITEADGKVTSFNGRQYELTSPNILASNGLLHTIILETLQGR